MPENLKNNKSESRFHRQRKAFVVLNNGILVAPDGFEGSHFDLLRECGFSAESVRRLIAELPRGYASDGSVYLYQGADFSCLSAINREKAFKWFSFFQKNDWLKTDGKIYDGMHIGDTGTVWCPIKEFKISF